MSHRCEAASSTLSLGKQGLGAGPLTYPLPHPHSINETESQVEAEGPDPALAWCGQKSTFTFLPREASQEASPQPRVAPGHWPSHFLPEPNCLSQLLQGRGPEEGGKVERSPRWGEVGGNPSP